MKIYYESFKSASENMRFDESLLEKKENCIRLYEWQNPGITYPEKRALPEDLHHLDHATRITGGGIVFHSSGDVVITVMARLDDPNFPSKLKEKLYRITEWIQAALKICGIYAKLKETQPSEKNLQFCQSYFSPYELYSEGVKVCGLTLKKYREYFILQGILHLANTEDYFADLPKFYHPFFSKGILPTKYAEEVMQALKITPLLVSKL
ncbi:MAG: hypothetical protein EXS67_06245 [Candidatus Margulisbacteria bacterium]|nr:hypothetical protein [Candidatus Margulisiibacteriota bacterium]